MALDVSSHQPRLAGPYRLLQRLGEGGMGVVHLALDPQGRAVAVKLLRPHVASDPDARRRLEREVATLRRIRHPRVAAVIDADVEGDVPYLVTHFVPGKPLDSYVRDHGPLPRGHIARVGAVLADALRAIHAAGVVHRDVKPANVLLLDGEPVLIDFGIAHLADESRITHTGLVMGTPGYLSPEIIGGEPVTAATDWWGWGATLAFAATGRPPFGTGPIEVVLDRVRRGESDLRGVDPGLCETLTAALAVDPARRPTPDKLIRGLAAGAPERSRPAGVAGAGAGAVAAGAGAVAARPPVAAQAATSIVPPPSRGEAPAGIVPSAAFGEAATAVVQSPDRPATRRLGEPSYGRPGTPANPGVGRGAPLPPYGPMAAGAGVGAAQPAPWARPTPPQPVSGGRQNGPGPINGYAQRPGGVGVGYGSSRGVAGPGYAAGSGAAGPGYAAGSGAVGPGYAAGSGAVGPGHAAGSGAGYSSGPVGRDPNRAYRSGPQRPSPHATGAAGPADDVAEPVDLTRGVLIGAMVGLAAIAAVAPYGAVWIAGLIFVCARVTDRTRTALLQRRDLRGRRDSDVVLAVLLSPWRILVAILTTVICLILPELVGIAVAFIIATAQAGAPARALPGHPLPLALGMVALLLTAWFGPGGGSIRRGAQIGMRLFVTTSRARIVVWGVLGLILLSALIVANSGNGPDWGPMERARLVHQYLSTSN